MKPKNDRPKSNVPEPKKRFSLQKLEERIAPHCRGNHLWKEDCSTIKDPPPGLQR